MNANKSRTKRWALALLAALCLGAAAKLLFFPAAAAPRYVTAKAVVADLEEAVLASGTLEAVKQVSVGAQASGQVKSLKVALGDQVRKGQLVAEIDSLPQQNALRSAEAALANVQAQRRSKQAALRQAELAFKRQREMLGQDASSRQDYESAEATLLAVRAEVEALAAQIEQARVDVDKAKVDLGYTKINAPMDGVVVAIVTKEGQTVNAAQQTPTIIKLAQMDQMTVKAQISEADVVRVRPGQEVYFTILGEPDHRYRAVLRAIEPAPDSINNESESASTSSSSSASSSAAVYYNGLFDVPNPDGKLRISMTAQATIVLAQAKEALTIPSAALGERDGQGRRAVRVLDASGRTVARKVAVGLGDGVRTQILDGLAEGEEVVVGEAKPDAVSQMPPRRAMRF